MENIEITSPLGKSDHAVINFSIKSDLKWQDSRTEKYIFKKGDYEKMKKDLDVDWETCLAGADTNESWNRTKLQICNSMKNNIPKIKQREQRKKKYKKALPEDLVKKIKKKHRQWQRYTETQEGEKYQEYCKARNKIRNLTKF